MKKIFLSLVSVTCLIVNISGCSKTNETKELTIFHAGSLAKPFEDLSAAFEKKHPGVKTLREASGSVTAARKISDLHKPADIIGSADYLVIQNLLMPNHTDFLYKFATNEMAIMYSPHSKYAKELTAQNWTDILLQEGVKIGRSDPNTDPCGYRTLITWQLAEKFYAKPGLYEQLLAKTPPQFIRPKETDLLALLETGDLDYIFIYRSVAEQHNGKFLLLPEQINLKSSQYADFYKQASVQIAGEKPGETITQVGEPMVYGIAALKNSKNYDLALEFINFVIGPEGQKIMAQNGQPPIVPAEKVENSVLSLQ
ncbi:MAG: tungstate ABC transporter substrate-binding protein WtpA [Pseudomonadota bacterium]